VKVGRPFGYCLHGCVYLISSGEEDEDIAFWFFSVDVKDSLHGFLDVVLDGIFKIQDVDWVHPALDANYSTNIATEGGILSS
jgi:hypothetical protein